ncbi:DUF6414 family protein [Nocardia brasiliensis]
MTLRHGWWNPRTWHWWKFWTWFRRSRLKSRTEPAFREFIYLDEISVVSLLVSREGEITEQIQEGMSREENAQIDSTLGAGLKGVKAESKSSYQTKNSQSIQTTRKANIQSQFKKLRNRAEKEDLIFPGVPPRKEIKDVSELLKSTELCRSEDLLVRGDLVELEVALRADRTYRLGSMLSEIASMGEEHPEIFGAFGGNLPTEMRSYAKLMERFMVGLIPIRAVVKNVCLYEHDGTRYIVDALMVKRLGLATKEIELVGVSEKDSYWKDIRRVLFSESLVKVLARVNVDGIRSSWSPVILIDLFESMMPGARDQLSQISRIDISQPAAQPNGQAGNFKRALVYFATAAAIESSQPLSSSQQTEIESMAETLRDHVSSSENQLLAFSQISQKLNDYGISVDANAGVRLRRQARSQAALPIFATGTSDGLQAPPTAEEDARLLAVEIIAMYW